MLSLFNQIKKLKTKKISDSEKEQQDYKDELINTIRETELALKNAYSQFDYAEDNDSIESCIYNIKALETKYKMLVKKARENKIKCSYQETFIINERKESLFNE